MATYQVLYWHGIPAQVRAKDENGRVSRELPTRFINAIDKAAMASKRTSGDAYTEGFHWGKREKRDGTAAEVADAVVKEIDSQYPTIDYRSVALKLRAENKAQDTDAE